MLGLRRLATLAALSLGFMTGSQPSDDSGAVGSVQPPAVPDGSSGNNVVALEPLGRIMPLPPSIPPRPSRYGVHPTHPALLSANQRRKLAPGRDVLSRRS